MQPTAFILFGRSGSGKGTQAELLEETLNEREENGVIRLATGKQFREFITKDSHTSALAKEIVDSGKLMPAFLPIWIWTGWFIENFTGSEHVILDGLARRPEEAPVLEEALLFYGFDIRVLFLTVAREEATRRLQARGRSDDTSEEIGRRLDWFDTHVMPAVEHFRTSENVTFHEVDGNPPIEEVREGVNSHIWGHTA